MICANENFLLAQSDRSFHSVVYFCDFLLKTAKHVELCAKHVLYSLTCLSGPTPLLCLNLLSCLAFSHFYEAQRAVGTRKVILKNTNNMQTVKVK